MHPIALPPLLATHFLDYILQYHQPPTTLLICSTREAFLEELEASIAYALSSREATEGSSPPIHHLLVPTIHLIATSRTINLAFAPTLPHLRAFLATHVREELPAPATTCTRSQQNPLLAIWGLVALHRSTAEHSAQGLSRTSALAVETAEAARQRLVLAESSNILHGGHDAEGGAGNEPWKEQVPLLSGSVRFGGEERSLGGRMLEVRAVIGRWCHFVRAEGLEDST